MKTPIINDLNGMSIKVADLGKAIKQAREFVGYRHTDAAFVLLDQERNRYWQDILMM